MSVRGIVNDRNPERGKGCRAAINVDGDDRPRAGRDRRGRCLEIERSGSRIDIDKDGDAPARHTAAAVGTAVNAGTITSSPSPTPAAESARRIASVPDPTATAKRRSVTPANSRSKASVSGPSISLPEESTRAMDSSSSSRIACKRRRRSTIGSRGPGGTEREGLRARGTKRGGNGRTRAFAKGRPRA